MDHGANQDRLDVIAEHCRISPYFLRIDNRKRVSIHVPPTVRARLLSVEQLNCIRTQLGAITGARLVGDEVR